MNMKHYLLSVLIIFGGVFSLVNSAQAQHSINEEGIEFFHGSWEEVLKEAKAKKRVIFVDAYTSWCGPCKMMARSTFTDGEVGKFYNKNFINYKLDMEKGEGPNFAAKFAVRAYPTLLYINHKEEVVHKVLGFRPPDKFLAEGKVAANPAKNQAALEEEVKAGTNNSQVLFDYAMKLYNAGEDYSEAAGKYFKTQSTKDLASERNWKAIQALSSDLKSREMNYLFKKQKIFVKKYGVRSVNNKIANVCAQQVERAVREGDEGAFKEAVKVANKSIDDEGKVATSLSMYHAEMMGDWDEYAKQAVAFFNNYRVTDPLALNNAAWNFFLHVDNKKHLESAIKWGKQSVAIENAYYNNDTVASLLYKAEKHGEALKIANKALRIAEENGEDGTETEKLIQMIKKAQNGN